MVDEMLDKLKDLMNNESGELISVVPIEESDCCGNGCANCILNIKPKPLIEYNLVNKRNIIENYVKFQLISKEFYEELPDILQLHFKWNSNGKIDDLILHIPPGHHIMLRFTSNNYENELNKKFILRPYSPFWTNAIEFEFKILVNLKPQGEGTKYLANILKVGMEAEFRGPIGNLQLENSNNFVCIITQGIAIAPTIPIIEKILQEDDNETRIWHLICGVDLKHIYFRKQLLEFQSFWNYKNTIFVAREPCEENHTEICTIDKCKCFSRKLHYKELAYARKLNYADIDIVCKKYENCKKICIIAGTREFQNNIIDLIKTHQIVREENLYLL